MLSLNLSQWKDMTVVDHERVHDLRARHGLTSTDDIGLDMARKLAREAGCGRRCWATTSRSATRST